MSIRKSIVFLALLLIHITATAAHLDIPVSVGHTQHPNGASYLTTPLSLSLELIHQAQTHWNVTRANGTQVVVHIHTECRKVPSFAEVTQEFTVECRVTLFQQNALATLQPLSSQWQEGGTSAGKAGPSVPVFLTPDPNGAVTSPWYSMTIRPSQSKKSGLMWLKLKSAVRFNVEPNFTVVASLKVPLIVVNNKPDSGVNPAAWFDQSAGIGHHFNDAATPKGKQHEFKYSFNQLDSFPPVGEITEKWTVAFRLSRAEGLEDCGVEVFDAVASLDPNLHAFDIGTVLKSHSGISPDDQHWFESVVLDPATLTLGPHNLMLKTDSIAIPSNCDDPGPPFQTELNMIQSSILMVPFIVGQTGLPQCSNGIDDPDQEDTLIDAADPGCIDLVNGYDPNDNDETDDPLPPQLPADIYVPGLEAGQSSGTWDMTNDTGDVTYNKE